MRALWTTRPFAVLTAALVLAGAGVAIARTGAPLDDLPAPGNAEAVAATAQAPTANDVAASDAEAPAEAPAEALATVASPPPAWLGTRALPMRDDGFAHAQPTPAELRDRRLVTVDLLPPPPDATFRSTIAAVPADVAARSTWQPQCPVSLEDLRYLTVSFWGFDERAHTGELLVHATVAEALVEVFRRLHDGRFPIEEMRVTAAEELDAPATGDGNNTTGFVCRPSRGMTAWSQHAHGLAVDINPFHNPYAKGEIVAPELATAYVDRADVRPGMILPGDVVTRAFAEIGWGWGGDWRSLKDWMHFSANGR